MKHLRAGVLSASILVGIGFSGIGSAADCPANDQKCIAAQAQRQAQQQAQQQRAQQQQQAQQAQQQAQQQRAQQQQQAQQQAQQRAQAEAQQRAQHQRPQQAQQGPQSATSKQVQQTQQGAASKQVQQNQQGAASKQVQQNQQGAASKQPQQGPQGAPSNQAQQFVPGATSKPAQQLTSGATSKQAQQSGQAASTQQAQQRVPPSTPSFGQQAQPKSSAATPQANAAQQGTMPHAGPGPQAYAPTAKPTPSSAAAPRPVSVNATTSVVPRPDRSGFAIHHQNADGSQFVVTQKRLPNGAPQVVGYKQVHDARLGATTRIYSDGYRVTTGRDFYSRSVYGGPTYYAYRSGLHAAMLANGRPIYREGYAMMRGFDGREHRVIQRTVYAQYWRGSPVFLTAPVVRVYDVATVYGEPVYLYRPSFYEPTFYRPFWAPFAVAVAVTPACIVCPAQVVAFASPVASYENPIDLVGDLQISTAFDDGATSPVQSGPDQNDDAAALAEMRNQMSDLQRQVSASVESDNSLKAQFANQGGQTRDLQGQLDALKTQQAINNMAPVQVSEEVRQQIRQQVRLSIAQHQNQHQMAVSDVIGSGYQKIYIFQAAAPLNVNDADTGDECFLNTGDLIGFAKVPTGDSPVAQMKVITSGARSCRPKQVVDVRLTDLQEMLNGFIERVEDNMKRVNSCATAPGNCVRA